MSIQSTHRPGRPHPALSRRALLAARRRLMLGLGGKLQADAADALAVAITHAHVRASANRLGVNVREAWSRK